MLKLTLSDPRLVSDSTAFFFFLKHIPLEFHWYFSGLRSARLTEDALLLNWGSNEALGKKLPE